MQKSPRYVGLVASRRKAFRLVQRVAARGGNVDLARLYAPVGIDLGALTPEELAVSIVAELIALRRGKPVAHLRAVDDPRLARSRRRGEAMNDATRARSASACATSSICSSTRSATGSRRGARPAASRCTTWSSSAAGQGGLAAAFGLMRERVGNLLVIDQNPLDRAGPWLNFARMHTLRTPKHVIGPDLGVPSLTPRAWYEAQHGDGSWESLGLIPKESWAAYLGWYRKTLGIPVRPDTRVGALEWDARERAWRVPCSASTERRRGGSSSTRVASCSRRASRGRGSGMCPR